MRAIKAAFQKRSLFFYDRLFVSALPFAQDVFQLNRKKTLFKYRDQRAAATGILLKNALEFKSKACIEREQTQLLREQVDYVNRYSPFYKKVLARKKLRHTDIHSLKDLALFPLTQKENLQKYNRDFYCVPQKHFADIVSTTGTTGDPVFIVLTCHDLQRLAKNEVYSFSCAGARAGDSFHLAVTVDNLFMAGIAYYLGIIQLGAHVYRAGMHTIKRHILLLNQLKPTGIMTVPSFLLQLGTEIRAGGINPQALSVTKALLVGESIRDENFHLSGIGKLIAKVWPLDLYSTLGNSETAVSYCECQEKQGAHEHPDLIISEIIDEKGAVVPDGEIGELVLTTLQTQGMPLVRYCTGDITFKIVQPCRCGRKSIRLGPILGRKAHMLKYKGTKVYPKAIENALANIDGINNYVIEAFTGDNFSDTIIVKIAANKRTGAFKQQLQAHIKAFARVTPSIEFVASQEIESLKSDGGRNRKLRTFIDYRKNKKNMES